MEKDGDALFEDSVGHPNNHEGDDRTARPVGVEAERTGAVSSGGGGGGGG